MLERGPVGIAVVGVTVTGDIIGDAIGAGRFGGAPPHAGPLSRRSENPPLSEKPPRPRPMPRVGGLYPRGPDGGTAGPSGLDGVLVLVAGAEGGDRTGTEKFLLLLGPVGGLKAAGPRGGDRGAAEGATSL